MRQDEQIRDRKSTWEKMNPWTTEDGHRRKKSVKIKR